MFLDFIASIFFIFYCNFSMQGGESLQCKETLLETKKVHARNTT